MNVKTSRSRVRIALALALSLVVAGVMSGTALAATGNWDQIWAQLQPLLGNPGTINNSTNPVHWTKLKGVPAGLADGLDNGVDRAGFGLKKNVVPNLEFAVDTARIQQRVTDTCSAGTTIQEVRRDGTVVCSPGGVVYDGGHDFGDSGSQPVGNSWATLGGALDLPSGAWSIVGIATIGSSDLRVRCRLEAWVDGSQAQVLNAATAWTTDGLTVPVALTGAHQSADPFHVAVVCKDGGYDAYWSKLRITATQVSEVRTVPIG